MNTLISRRPAILLIILAVVCVALLPTLTQAQNFDEVNPPESSLKDGILPECDPSSSDLAGKGCGVNDAIQLVYNIIKYVSIVIIPIAVLLLGYAGFTIMTSAGNTEKISQAKHMIQLVVVGLVIIFLSAMIVRYVFIALNTSQQFRPQ